MTGTTCGPHRVLPITAPARARRVAGTGAMSCPPAWLLLAALVLLGSPWAAGQALPVLHVRVTLLDASGQPAPVPHHALLVSDEPPTDAPRRVVTGLDGTVDVRLRPGTYTVESDRPVLLGGRAYQWRQTIEIPVDRAHTLDLTAENAEVETAAPDLAASGPPEHASTFLLPRWQDSVVALWTPTSRVSGFLADARGLVVTSRTALGGAAPVAVQLSPTIKVPARVLVTDPARRAAVLWMDPSTAASMTPVPVECPPPAALIADGQEVFTIGMALRGTRDLAVGTAGVRSTGVVVDVSLEPGADGGPVFTAAGGVAGVTALADEADETGRGDVRLIGLGEVCEALALAAKRLGRAEIPAATRLPVEPERSLTREALEAAAPPRIGSLAPYQASSSDFNVTFITPPVAYAARRRTDQEHTGGGVPPEAAWERQRLLTDFGTWSEYFRDVRPVLVVRVTPKLAEGFWTRVARGAAWTQGISLPPINRRKPGFARMRVRCGSAEVTPVQPFTTDARASEGDAIREGLYVFEPGALGPHCGAVTLVLSSEKAPDRGDMLVVDPKVVERVWRDFESYRAGGVPGA